MDQKDSQMDGRQDKWTDRQKPNKQMDILTIELDVFIVKENLNAESREVT